MEAHDLVLAKLVAGREKDFRFARAAIAEGVVRVGELKKRARSMPNSKSKELAVQRLEICAADAGSTALVSGGGRAALGGRVWIRPHRRGGAKVRGYWRG